MENPAHPTRCASKHRSTGNLGARTASNEWTVSVHATPNDASPELPLSVFMRRGVEARRVELGVGRRPDSEVSIEQPNPGEVPRRARLAPTMLRSDDVGGPTARQCAVTVHHLVEDTMSRTLQRTQHHGDPPHSGREQYHDDDTGRKCQSREDTEDDGHVHAGGNGEPCHPASKAAGGGRNGYPDAGSWWRVRHRGQQSSLRCFGEALHLPWPGPLKALPLTSSHAVRPRAHMRA